MMFDSAAPCEEVADEVLLSLLPTTWAAARLPSIYYVVCNLYFESGEAGAQIPGTNTTPTRPPPSTRASRPTRLHASTPPLGLVALSTLSMNPLWVCSRRDDGTLGPLVGTLHRTCGQWNVKGPRRAEIGP